MHNCVYPFAQGEVGGGGKGGEKGVEWGGE